MISELCQHFYSYTYIFSTEELKQTLRMILSGITSCEDYELWKLSTMLSTCHNWELLIAHPHRPLCFKKIRTTSTAMLLISNTVVLNPYSHSTAFSPLVLSSRPDIQILYGLQIDNNIWQCVTAAELKFSGISLWSMFSTLDLLHCFLFQCI